MKHLSMWRNIALLVTMLFILATGVIYADEGNARIYKVTIMNLTSGQPFTPPLLATHARSTGIFEVGEAAGFELKEIAENGNLGPMIEALGENDRVHEVVVGGAPIVPPDNPGGTGFASSASFLIGASGRANFLSWGSMLICTNDGITGVDSLRLPRRIGDKVTVETAGYDAGTETNTEDFADMVPPCQGLIGISSDDQGTGMSNPALAEDEVIRMHPGIMGVTDSTPNSDLVPGVHGWTDPVAIVMVERIPLKFKAELDGSQEVPPVDTDTEGKFKLEFNSHLTEAQFDLKVKDGVSITQSHLHCAPEGANGPVVAFLFGFIPGGFDVDGRLAKFTLTDANIVEGAQGCADTIGMPIGSIADLAHAMSMNNIYVNVHSIANPSGEVRGQALSGGGDDDDDDDDDDDNDDD